MKLFRTKDLIILILGLLLSGFLALIWHYSVLDVGEKVIVSYNGEVEQTFDLHADGEYILVHPEGKNSLTISGGKASVTDADCPDRLCVHQKAISQRGEAIICLPHKLVITIEGGDTSPEIDAITN